MIHNFFLQVYSVMKNEEGKKGWAQLLRMACLYLPKQGYSKLLNKAARYVLIKDHLVAMTIRLNLLFLLQQKLMAISKVLI